MKAVAITGEIIYHHDLASDGSDREFLIEALLREKAVVGRPVLLTAKHERPAPCAGRLNFHLRSYLDASCVIKAGSMEFVPVSCNIYTVQSVHDVGDKYYPGKYHQEYFLWCEYMQLHYYNLQMTFA